MNTRLNLTALADFDSDQQALGRLPLVNVERIHPDPRNAILRERDAATPDAIAEQAELDADVSAVGLKSPLSLRPYPDRPGEYIINHGHRRFRAALNAGLREVPYFLDDSFTSYDQVKENLLRRNLTPWAFAEFIKSRQAAGDSNTAIANGLGKGQAFVTLHLALVDAPACLHAVYDHGIKSPRTLYELRRVWDQYPQQVDAWLASTSTKVTRDSIKEFEALCHGKEMAAATVDTGGLCHGKETPGISTDLVPLCHGKDSAPDDTALCHGKDTAPQVTVQEAAIPGPAVSATPQAPVPPRAPLASAKPPARTREIIVQYKGKPARIAASTTVRISLDGLDAEIEVPLAELVFKP